MNIFGGGFAPKEWEKLYQNDFFSSEILGFFHA